MQVPDQAPHGGGAESATSGTLDEESFLVEVAGMFARGNVDRSTLWALFDTAELYMEKPPYLGAPILDTGTNLVTPVFSSVERLTEFMRKRDAPDVDSFDWVRVTGAGLFGLPVRARLITVDPSEGPTVIIDLASRSPHPRPRNGAPVMAINLQRDAAGNITGGMPNGEPDMPDATPDVGGDDGEI